MSTPTPLERDRDSPISIMPATRLAGPGRPPASLTPLIGRAAERARVVQLVRDGARLLTLTGIGGVGKTRLAQQLAVDLEGAFADGVVWVSLATVRDAELVAEAIAHAMGVQASPSQDPSNAVKAALRDARLLLILDNLEQVLPAAEELAGLLAACPNLVILATSRTLLRVSGEHAVRVPPLELPDVAVADADLAGSEAARLFIERARAVYPELAIEGDEALAAAEICRRLEGLPLAIELAAAWVSMLPLPALSARLARRLPLLTGGDRDQPSRLRTMRDAIAWSYDLLDAHQRAVFRRVAIYSGGCRLDAVVPLCRQQPSDLDSPGNDPPTHPEAVAATLTCIRALTDHNLIQQVVDPDGEPRYLMLETIREYALEQLDLSGERERAERSRANYLTRLTERHIASTGEVAIDLLDLEQANFRDSLAWLIKTGDEERAFRLAGILAQYWIAQGYYQQGRSSLEQLLAGREPGRAIDRAEALVGLGYTLLFQGDRDRARVVLEEALRVCRVPEDSLQVAMSLTGLGVVAGLDARYREAMELLENALATGRALEDTRQAAFVAGSAHSPLGTMAHGQGMLRLARDHHLRSLAVRRELGDTRGVSRALADLGNVAVDQGDQEQALKYYRESLALAAQYRTPPFVTHAVVGTARIAITREQPERAARLLGAADALRGEIEATLTMEFEYLARERAHEAAQAALGDERFASALTEGRSLTLEGVISELDSIGRPTTEPIASDSDRGPTAAAVAYGLTPREIEVLQGIVDYLTDREIAERLFISRRTVGWHVTSILSKLGVESRRQAATKAIDEGLM